MSIEPGILYIVATPIGNLRDITERAVNTLASVDLIAAEDTRHSRSLLRHFGIEKPVLSLHEHNERTRCACIMNRLLNGQSVALVSDAGTPLLSDPGYHVVRSALQNGVRVAPVPGPCAVIAALSVSGLPTDRFVFEGFLPARRAARRARLEALRSESRTLVFFESSHRVRDTLVDLCEAFSPNRQATLARELTKIFETVRHDTLSGLRDWLVANPEQRKGELVLVVEGNSSRVGAVSEDHLREILRLLLSELSVKQAVRVVAELTGAGRNQIYPLALELDRVLHGQNNLVP